MRASTSSGPHWPRLKQAARDCWLVGPESSVHLPRSETPRSRPIVPVAQSATPADRLDRLCTCVIRRSPDQPCRDERANVLLSAPSRPVQVPRGQPPSRTHPAPPSGKGPQQAKRCRGSPRNRCCMSRTRETPVAPPNSSSRVSSVNIVRLVLNQERVARPREEQDDARNLRLRNRAGQCGANPGVSACLTLETLVDALRAMDREPLLHQGVVRILVVGHGDLAGRTRPHPMYWESLREAVGRLSASCYG